MIRVLGDTNKGGKEMANKKNYSKISTEKVKAESKEETAVKSTLEPEVTEEVKTEVKPQIKKGIVTGCAKLNMRVAPSVTAKIRGTLDQRTTVIILGDEGDFYKIGNPENPDYVMKKYITVLKK
jgi:hypothetical protein